MRDDRLVGLRVELDALDASDDHAGGLHRRAQLQAADVVEARLQRGSPAPSAATIRLPTLSARNRIAAMPIATNMPTHRSMGDRFMRSPSRSMVPQWQSRRRPRNMNTVRTKSSAKDRERASDDGARRRRRHAFGGRLGVVALEHGDQAHRNAENDALDHAVDDIAARSPRPPACCPRTRRRRCRSASRRRGRRRRRRASRTARQAAASR